MNKGTVKWFNDKKGYGFIACDGDEGDIFVHYSAIQSTGFKTLTEGTRVIFDIETNAKGRCAVNVKPE